MAQTVGGLLRDLQAISLNEETAAIINKKPSGITNLNKEQLYSGKDSAGNELRQYRDSEYATMKNEINPLPGLGTPDLKLTGAFYESFEAKATANTYAVTATDTKATKLEKKYGANIYGLSNQNVLTYRTQTIVPGLVRIISAKTGIIAG